MARPTVVQFNTSPSLGGAEVYTAFFSRALIERGWRTRVVVDPAAAFWNDLDFGAAARVSLTSPGAAVQADEVALVHAPLPGAAIDALSRHRVIGVAHQAIYDGSYPAYYDRADTLLAVSQHVIDSLSRSRFARVHPTPLLGVADLARGEATTTLSAGALFDADRRKPRDRLMAAFAKARASFSAPRNFERRPGLTLGVVSRLAPLKQFPALFAQLVPVLERHPRVNVELFGAAVGYKTLAAIRRSLSPLGSRVRFWGQQRDVRAAYAAIDYLLTGLPEREALGLNALEACLAGTPVLAVAAPPFTETLVDGVTGYLYNDPRNDGAADFERVLDGIETGALRPRMDLASPHLTAFSFASFADRVDHALDEVLSRPRAARV
ncbi:MAG: glycosyltransferase [Betaproteobacteria bacterium]